MAMSDERILTLHPEGKQGVNIKRDKYEAMREALLRVIPKTKQGIAFGELAEAVRPHLDAEVFPPESSVTWYVVTVKQDLEARELIERVAGRGPQRVRRIPTRGRRD